MARTSLFSHRSFLEHVWDDARLPVAKIIAHGLVSIASVAAVKCTELAGVITDMVGRTIPYIGITFGDWLFAFEVLIVSVIMSRGVLRALAS